MGLGEARERVGDAVRILGGPLDIIWRMAGQSALRPADMIQHVEQPVKANGRTVEGSEIKRTHSMTSSLSDMRTIRFGAGSSVTLPLWPAPTLDDYAHKQLQRLAEYIIPRHRRHPSSLLES